MEWIRSAIKELPRYHQISSNFEPLLSTGMSPLFLACVFGLSGLLDRLLAQNPNLDLEERSDTGHTGLYLACSYGHDHVVSKLLSHNADMNIQCGSFGTPFNVACFRGHADVVQILLAHKTAPRTTGAFSDAFRAACRGARENVALVVAKAFLIIWTESEYRTALQEAVETGFSDLVEWLMSPTTAGPFSGQIGSSARDQKGSAERLLHTAIKLGQVSVLRSLLRMKPHWQDLLPLDAMALAGLSGRADMLLALHDLGRNAEQEGVFGSPLRSASLMGNERAVRLLLEWGADPAASGSKGDALQAAAQNGHLQFVTLLLEEGADVNQTGSPRGTPIQAAAFYGHLDVVDLLLERGADMYKGGKSQDALYAAIEGGNEVVAALLLKKGYRVAAGADLPDTMRGSLDRVQRPWEKKRTNAGEQLGIARDDDDDGFGSPLPPRHDAIDPDEEDCDISASDLKKFSEYDHPDSPLFDNEDGIGVFELSAAAGDARASQGSDRTLVDACLDWQGGESPESTLKDLLDAAIWSKNEKMVRTVAAKMEEHGCDTSAILPAFASACRRGFRAIKPLLTSERLNQNHLSTGLYTAAIFGRRWVLCDLLSELARRGFPFSRADVVDRAFIGAAAHETSHLREKFAKFPWAITRAMIIAARGGHEDNVQECLREGADVDGSQLPDNMVSLHWREDGALAIEVDPEQMRRILLFFPKAEITPNKIGTMDLKIEETAPSQDRRLRFSKSTALEGFRKETWELADINEDLETTDGSQVGKQKQERIVFLILEQGCDPNAANKSGKTPIETAVKLATDGVVQRLLESGVEIPRDDSLVALAAKRGSFRIVLQLLQAGASIPRTRDGFLTPEMLQALQPGFGSAEANGHPFSMQEARRFINSGMRALLRIILGQHSSQRARISGGGMRAVVKAARLGRGPAKRASDPVFGNLLVVAATAGDNETVKLLIDHGVDVNSNFKWSSATALSGAAHYGHRQVMDTLLQNGADVNGGNADTKEPLIMAIRGRQLTALKALVEHGARPSPPDPTANAYQQAVALDDPRILDFLLKHLGPPDKTILVSAAADGKANHVALLLAAGARVDDLVYHPCFDPAPCGRGTALYIACLNGHTKVVEQLLRKGANPNLDINSNNRLGLPLTAAAGAGHLDIVRLLLDNAADPNAHSIAPIDVGWAQETSSQNDDEEWSTDSDDTDEMGPTALSEACRNNHPAIVKELLARGATVSVGTSSAVVNPLTVLSTGSWSTTRKEMLEQLLETASEEAGDERKQAVTDALTEAALEHNCDAFELILEYVASSTYILGLASVCGSERSVLRCLDQGVDVNAVSPSHELPLHHPANNMHSRVVQLLIDRGADVNQLEYSVEGDGQNNNTALMAALLGFLVMLQGDHTSQKTRDRLSILDLERIVHCLLDSGADPELGYDSRHNKALHLAGSVGDPSLVNILLDRGAKLDSGGSYHGTPLFSALDWKRPRVVRLLLVRGADPNAPRVLERDATDEEDAAAPEEDGEHGNRLQTPLEAALGWTDNMVLLKTFLQYAKGLKISGRASWVRNDDAIWELVALRSGDRARVDELRKKRRTRFPPGESSRPRGLIMISEYRTMMEGGTFEDELSSASSDLA
ncbi:ankyrin repeat-containing domain protein [Aspergillus pseudoustus]|uniref:Ankyrin repeat-containing domain protein n=1 Tax=Aspergillus pseudoustus TaxID=1810923 RepID=A0ABR4KFW4_9EURO